MGFVRGGEARRRRSSAALMVALAVSAAWGCSPHLVVQAPEPSPDGLAQLSVAVDAAPHEGELEPLLVEVLDGDRRLVTRFFTDAEPRTARGIPPGRYTVRVQGRRLGEGPLEAGVRIEEGRSVVVLLQATARSWSWQNALRATGRGAGAAGGALLTATTITARIAVIVATLGFYAP